MDVEANSVDSEVRDVVYPYIQKLLHYLMAILSTSRDMENQSSPLPLTGDRTKDRCMLGCTRPDSGDPVPVGVQVHVIKSHSAPAKVWDRVGQCCFLCLSRKRTGPFAVQVPCFRPTKSRRCIRYRNQPTVGCIRQSVRVPGSEIYEELNQKERSCESDTAIYNRLKETCFQYQGRWKKWLPFYGIINVREVKFQFRGVEPDGRFPILNLQPVDVTQIREDADRTILNHTFNDIEYEEMDFCLDELHSESCASRMCFPSARCLEEEVHEAHQRKRKLGMLHVLRDCARNPFEANGLYTLEGMAQDSCIYDTREISVPKQHERYKNIDSILGLEFVLGWQIDLLSYALPFSIMWTIFVIGVVWLCVIAWAGPSNDWGTAMAFGQLIVASFSLMSLYSED